MNLYILGNGFDLMHNLPTRYCHFAELCMKNYATLYREMTECFKKLDKIELWSNFEDALGFPDMDYMQHNYKKNQIANRDDRISVDISELKEAFGVWIASITQKIASYEGEKLFNFKDGDVFINFNYTDTLEALYKINKNILYIHNGGERLKNSIMEGITYTGYIFGHNEKLPEDVDFEIKEELRYLKKDFQYDTLNDFLINKEVNNIIVIGHSMAKVDYGYFEIMNKKFPAAQWLINYHNEDDKKRKINSIEDIGIINYCLIDEKDTILKQFSKNG